MILATEKANAFSEACHLLAMRQAIVVASASTASLMQVYFHQVKHYVRLARQHRELEISLKTVEEALLLKMGTEMKRKERVLLCYELMKATTNGNSVLSALELVEGFRKLNLPLIKNPVLYYKYNNEELLLPHHLEDVFESTSRQLDCTFHDVTRLCVVKIAFGQNGRTILEDMVTHVSNETQIEVFEREVIRSRLILNFRMMDFCQQGRVPFNQIAKHLRHFTSSIDWQDGANVLLMMGGSNGRTMNLDEFVEFVFHFAASLSGMYTFHDLSNAFTLSACRQKVTHIDIKEFFTNDEKRVSAFAAEEAGFEDVVEYGKLERLHKLMDTDHSGTLDLCELALGMRKFMSCQDDVGMTIRECMVAIEAVDEDGDGQLDVREFAKLIAKFANSAQVEIHHLIDFMVVQCCMKSNSSQKEEEYLKAYRKIRGPPAPEKHHDRSIFGSIRKMMLQN